MISEVAAYMAKNPSLQVGVDGFRDPSDVNLSNRRIVAVHNGLVSAGVPANKVQIGAFGDPQLSRTGRVEMLLITNYSQNN